MPLFGPPNVAKLEAKKDISGLIRALGYRKDGAVREAAMPALVRCGACAVTPLIYALGDPDRDVRRAGASVLG